MGDARRNGGNGLDGNPSAIWRTTANGSTKRPARRSKYRDGKWIYTADGKTIGYFDDQGRWIYDGNGQPLGYMALFDSLCLR